MPIYMDRHNLKDVTLADVAEAHQKDLAIQDQYGVRYLTYWFDESRGTTFCLVDAPNKEAAECVHREAHGHMAGEVLEVPLAAVEAFLGRINDPPAQPGQQPGANLDAGRRAILFTDIVGSGEMTARPAPPGRPVRRHRRRGRDARAPGRPRRGRADPRARFDRAALPRRLRRTRGE